MPDRQASRGKNTARDGANSCPDFSDLTRAGLVGSRQMFVRRRHLSAAPGRALKINSCENPPGYGGSPVRSGNTVARIAQPTGKVWPMTKPGSPRTAGVIRHRRLGEDDTRQRAVRKDGNADPRGIGLPTWRAPGMALRCRQRFGSIRALMDLVGSRQTFVRRRQLCRHTRRRISHSLPTFAPSAVATSEAEANRIRTRLWQRTTRRARTVIDKTGS